MHIGSIGAILTGLMAQHGLSDTVEIHPSPRQHSGRATNLRQRVRNMGQRYKLRGQTEAQRLAALEKAEAKRARKAQFQLNQANQTNYRIRCAAA